MSFLASIRENVCVCALHVCAYNVPLMVTARARSCSYLASLTGWSLEKIEKANKHTKIIMKKYINLLHITCVRKCTNLVNREFIMIFNYDIDPLFIVWMIANTAHTNAISSASTMCPK